MDNSTRLSLFSKSTKTLPRLNNPSVYYETHFLTCIEDGQKECSIPSQIHIKMCCSREDCNNNTEIVMQKCKIHNRTSRTELCRPRRRSDKAPLFACSCQKKNNIYSKIFGSCFNFIQDKLTNPLEREHSSCMTSSGVSMSDEFVPVFQTVRQLRLENEKEKDEDLSLTDACKSTSTINLKQE